MTAATRIRRIGRWTHFNHPYNGPVWRLDGTELDLEHDPGSHAVCIGGDRCNGAWVLYEHGRYREPVAEHLRAAMEDIEQRWDSLLAALALLLAVRDLIARRFAVKEG